MAQPSLAAARRPSTAYAYGKAATAILPDARIDCVISEISVAGAKLACLRQPAVGQPLILAVPEIGALEALVTGHSDEGVQVTFEIAERERAPLASDLAALARPRLVV